MGCTQKLLLTRMKDCQQKYNIFNHELKKNVFGTNERDATYAKVPNLNFLRK